MLQCPSQFQVIKQCILDVHENQISRIDDEYVHLRELCEAVERLFHLGFRGTFRVRDYWHWMVAISKMCLKERKFLHPLYTDAINKVQHNSSVTTAQGRGRLMIRFLLHHSMLDFPVKFMLAHPDYATSLYDSSYSALSNEIYVQILHSLLTELCRVPFDLNLENAEFLDETWEMPVFERYELVPCSKLGTRLDFLDGHAVVTDLDPDGVAAEDNKVKVGDVVVSMYGKTLRNGSALITTLRNQNEGKPVPMAIIKSQMPNGKIFRPLESLLKRFGFEFLIPTVSTTPSDSLSSEPDSFFTRDSPGRLLYVGQCEVGSNGGVSMINNAILRVLMNRRKDDWPIPVHMELGELGIAIWNMHPRTGTVDPTKPPMFQHSFPQISSCGRRTDNTNYLAYIVGEEPCSIAKRFHCFVFEAVNKEEAKRLIHGIAQGFDRTHWTL
ncbi:hypothetical protein T265_03172 [Opisthorchis viverrini]|uniref:RUN domain protein n=1 Tax=Opisthorchis viverrini TaxID=6198 RepID=A0A075A4C3_OPIVI|nr:hypothetical protein T265_03172 [Opisthorchis viverrini]KER30440.1 hypothetical protein T265_03172 [Opisthorchis viverrini]